MTTLEELTFYKQVTQKTANFYQEAIHPEYGPCDGLRDGQCSVCAEKIAMWKEATERLQQVYKVVLKPANQLNIQRPVNLEQA